MTQVSIVVVSYNAETYLERCLSVIANREDEVIVVDSGSTDGSRELVRDRYSGVRLIELDENRGYGAAVNEGLRVASGRYLLVLNCDAWPVDDAIARLAAFAEDNPSVGVVGPRLLNPDGTLQRSVRGYPTLWRLATEYFFLRWLAPRSRLLNAFYGANFDHGSIREAEFLVGAVLLVPRNVAEKLGGFDTSFFMFNEEVDLCYRIHQEGQQVVFFPEAEFVHVGGAYTRTDRPLPPQYQTDRAHRQIATLHAVAADIGAAPSTVLYAWLLAAGIVPVVGVSRPEQLAEALAADALPLPADSLALLETARTG